MTMGASAAPRDGDPSRVKPGRSGSAASGFGGSSPAGGSSVAGLSSLGWSAGAGLSSPAWVGFESRAGVSVGGGSGVAVGSAVGDGTVIWAVGCSGAGACTTGAGVWQAANTTPATRSRTNQYKGCSFKGTSSVWNLVELSGCRATRRDRLDRSRTPIGEARRRSGGHPERAFGDRPAGHLLYPR